MARIYLDARNITDRPAGVGRYALSLIPELVRQGKEHHFVALRHRSNQRPIEVEGENYEELFVDAPIDKATHFLFGHRTLQAAFARGGKPDLFHSLFHLLPLRIKADFRSLGVVTTIHDFLWLDHARETQPTWSKATSIQLFANAAIPTSLKLSDQVIAISEPTRKRATAFIDAEKITTIGHGVDESFFQTLPLATTALPNFLLTTKAPLITAIGNDKAYKNLAILIEAFAALRNRGVEARLVLIGACEGLHHTIAHSGVCEDITATGFIDDQTLKGILRASRAFVFPSRREGFGLPILEAMAMGLPTLIADREPMRSIAAEGALRFDPDDKEALTNLLTNLLTREELANRLASQGRQRASSFRWPETAARTLEVYEKQLRQ